MLSGGEGERCGVAMGKNSVAIAGGEPVLELMMY